MVSIKCVKCKGETTLVREGLFKMNVVCNGCINEEHRCVCEVKKQ